MKYRKKSIDVEAVQFTGANGDEVSKFCGRMPTTNDGIEYPYFIADVERQDPTIRAEVWDKLGGQWVGVKAGQWIIKGDQGEFRTCDPAIFDMLYDVLYDDVNTIGPECFIGVNGSVISYKGANYYKACDSFVSDLPEGGQSFCVKRVNHNGDIHEDYNGRQRVGV